MNKRLNLDAYAAQSLQQARTMADSVAAALREAILQGALRDGEPLRQAELAGKFGVSRIPVREALLKLEREGLVETRPHRGTIVTALDAQAFQEILEMRTALESLALKLAIPCMRESDMEAAGRILKESEAALTAPGDGRVREFETRWGDLNQEFHCALYRAAGRSRLLDTIENLHLLFARHLRHRSDIIAPDPGDKVSDDAARNRSEWVAVLNEHRDLLDACRARDIAHAQVILMGHIETHGKELVRRLLAAS